MFCLPPVFGSRPDGTPSCMTLSAPFAPFLLLLLVRVLPLALPLSLLALVAPRLTPSCCPLLPCMCCFVVPVDSGLAGVFLGILFEFVSC